MNRIVIGVVGIALLGFSCASEQRQGAASDARSMTERSSEQGSFRPEQIQWRDGPPSLPAGAKFAILEGDPSKPGYFAMRLQVPDGYRIPPHWHPNVERVTVISGTFHLGMGERLDRGNAQALPAGTYAFMPPEMRHFAWAEGPAVIQITTLGPWEIHYVNPSDDPRKKP